jgi:thioredoxin-related protein
MTTPSRTFLAVLSVFFLASLVPAQEESRPASKPTKPKRADIYDTKAEGKDLVAAALEKAAKRDKRVLLVYGGNWCGWCHKLHDAFKTKDLAKTLFNEYEVAWIDIGRNDRNQDLVKEYVTKMEGVPYLTVLDSAGKVLTNQETGALEEGDHHDLPKVKAFLEKWQVPTQDAEKVLEAAYARAKAESKMVFLHFGAPGCGWCHRLEDFIARAEIAAILSADFVMVKIDEDRMTHGKEVEGGIRPKGSVGIPWIGLMDASGKALATSDGPDGNIGCPWKPEEIDWFIGMLKKVRNKITPEQLSELETALRKYAAPKTESRP